jgi:hypothetical protein
MRLSMRACLPAAAERTRHNGFLLMRATMYSCPLVDDGQFPCGVWLRNLAHCTGHARCNAAHPLTQIRVCSAYRHACTFPTAHAMWRPWPAKAWHRVSGPQRSWKRALVWRSMSVNVWLMRTVTRRRCAGATCAQLTCACSECASRLKFNSKVSLSRRQLSAASSSQPEAAAVIHRILQLAPDIRNSTVVSRSQPSHCAHKLRLLLRRLISIHYAHGAVG